MEIIFLLGFFVILLLTGVSMLGIFLALVAGFILMFFSSLLIFIIKILPWLLVALILVWLWRARNKPSNH